MSLPDLATTTITRRRFGAATVSSGIVTPGAATDTAITATVTPASGRVLQFIDGGDRQRSPVEVFTTTPLRLADPATGAPADRLVIDGAVYLVIIAKAYPALGTIPTYQHAVAVRLAEGQA